MAESNAWHSSVPNAMEYELERKQNVHALSGDFAVRRAGLELLVQVSKNGFGHKNKWLGAPIIRLPEDMIFQQELIFSERPDLIVEIGIARGGGLIFNASIQSICGIKPNVVGVDNKIFSHTVDAIKQSAFASSIHVIQGDSVSDDTVKKVSKLMAKSKKVLLVLDSDHSADHVLTELNMYSGNLPPGSVVIVCDTLIDELPPSTYKGRSWENGLGPLTAIRQFLSEREDFVMHDLEENNSLLMSEIRNGVLRKLPK